jgi:hypothetical protein
MRLFLAFSSLKDTDLEPSDIVLYNMGVEPSSDNYVSVNSFQVDEKTISEFYTSFVAESSRFDDVDLLHIAKACNNNLYTNHLVLFKWKEAIDTILAKHDISEVIVTDLVSSMDYAPYYEAEGEAHVRLMYKPYDFIPSVLHAYLKRKYSLRPRVLRHRSKALLLLRIVVRRYVLLLVKLLFYIFKLLKFKFSKHVSITNNTKLSGNVFTTRSIAHYDAIQKVSSQSGNDIVFCGEGAFTFLDNYTFTKKNYELTESFLFHISLFDLIKYLKTAVSRLTNLSVDKHINYDNMQIPYRDSLKEMCISYFEVDLLECAQSRFISKCDLNDNSILFTSEMYTPFAYSHARLGKELNIKTVQLQTTNMFVVYEPNFLYCDYFIFNSRTLVESYKEKYPENAEKTPFLGNFMVEKPSSEIKSFEKLSRVLYFTQPLTDEDIEQEILKKLCMLSEELHFTLLVKLHPRDTRAKLANFEGLLKVVDESASFDDYMRGIDVCVLKTSSIASKIVLKGVPILYCLYSEWARNGELDYIDFSYAGTTTKLAELEAAIKAPKSLLSSYAQYRTKYINQNGLDSGYDEFMDNLSQL